MDNKKLQYFKKKLLEEKEEQLKSLRNREKEIDETMDLLDSELSSYDNHPGDIGTEVYMLEQEKGYIEQIKSTIEKIDNSLEDIKNGNYGICDNCNKSIKEERLELIPYAKTCLKCANENEKNEGIDDEKIYESLNYNSFDLSPQSDNEDIGYDREDIYQDVLQDNVVPKDPSFSTGDNIGIVDEKKYNEDEMIEEIEKISQEDYEDTLE
ncbi:TraR/DksA C4-type zinc finger protein [Tissierella creatinophila]|uniref:General stress protein 16O n=1 Tax=Tissierella creatinophila DSM 6911 TaxID=1123403 RepID=A0A1U7M335_TISCR|nr:TraR/DksA C4-type zinc finger protein [Tissierella creatinophila]OLS01696.1 general stress protein 16O [Tissierella creatinophila DSM 6911]